MIYYNKIDLPNLISVSSVVTVIQMKEDQLLPPSPDMHDFWEIVCVKSGTFGVTVDDVPFILSSGEALIYPPLSCHAGIEEQRVGIDIISFESDSEILHAIAGRKIKLSESELRLITESVELGLKLKHKKTDETPSEFITDYGTKKANVQVLKKKLELLLTSIYALSETLTQSTERRGYKREYSESLTKFLRMNINKTLTLDDMARELSISVSRLKAISNEILGAPPIDYFITLKLEAAAKLIRDGELNFTQIAEKLGFSSVHYFSKLFKRRVGMTPTEYAKTH